MTDKETKAAEVHVVLRDESANSLRDVEAHVVALGGRVTSGDKPGGDVTVKVLGDRDKLVAGLLADPLVLDVGSADQVAENRKAREAEAKEAEKAHKAAVKHDEAEAKKP